MSVTSVTAENECSVDDAKCALSDRSKLGPSPNHEIPNSFRKHTPSPVWISPCGPPSRFDIFFLHIRQFPTNWSIKIYKVATFHAKRTCSHTKNMDKRQNIAIFVFFSASNSDGWLHGTLTREISRGDNGGPTVPIFFNDPVCKTSAIFHETGGPLGISSGGIVQERNSSTSSTFRRGLPTLRYAT